jgi:serpin B
MVTIIKVCLFAIILAVLPACEKPKDTETDNPPELTARELELTAHTAEVIVSINDFGIRLFTETAVNERDNMMLSPLSASTALTMLLNGCDGDTYSQIRDMLNYSENMSTNEINASYKQLVGQLLAADPKVKLALANAIFYRDGFDVKPPFLSSMQHDFDARIQSLDFSHPSALEVINSWADENTEGRIPKVLDRIDSHMVMFVMNALYFKGDWTYQFDKEATTEQPFYLDTGHVIQVPSMYGKPMVRHITDNSYTVVELNYGRTNFSMVIVVPDATLSEFYSDFTPGLWAHITKTLDEQSSQTEAMVSLPRFSFEYEALLDQQLRSLGMVDAFNPETANLSGMSERDIYVDFVKQNTFVEVNEEGTEAAAVTNIGVGIVSMPSIPHIKADQPFIFAIRERTTNTLLFIGSVSNPLN